MRAAWVAGFLLLAGCASGDGGDRVEQAIADCREAPPQQHVLYLAPGHRLAPVPPAAGAEPGNAFSGGFLTDDLKEWLSDPAGAGLWLFGDVRLEYWVRATGTPAPLALGGDPGQAYRFFNQFGSDRSFQPSAARHFGDVAVAPGTVERIEQVLAMPPGGFVVEAGDRVRLLLTDLALDGPEGSGHEVLFGGDTPSRVTFTAVCYPRLAWPGRTVLLDEEVLLPANQGLLFASIPASLGGDTSAEGGNFVTHVVRVPPGTQRLSVRLTQSADANPAKDDIDLVLLEPGTNATWGMGSPYADERGTLWADNLAAAFPAGTIEVRVDSYSGVAYQGRLVVTAERAKVP